MSIEFLLKDLQKTVVQKEEHFPYSSVLTSDSKKLSATKKSEENENLRIFLAFTV